MARGGCDGAAGGGAWLLGSGRGRPRRSIRRLDPLATRPLHELSIGQQQRAFIARAFAGEPELLVLDEPIAGVDAESQRRFRDSLVHLIRHHGAGVLLVSHELAAVADVIDRVVVLKRRVVFDGTPAELAERGVSLGSTATTFRSGSRTSDDGRAAAPVPVRHGGCARAGRVRRGRRLRADDRGVPRAKRLSLIGDGIAHVAFAGVGAGLLGGGPCGPRSCSRGRRRGRGAPPSRRKAAGDLALALFFYVGIALGAVFASRAGDVELETLSFLFGDPSP